MTMWLIGVSAARARRGWIAVVHRPPPATAAPAATEPFRNVRRDRDAGMAASSGDRGVWGSRARAPLAPMALRKPRRRIIAARWSADHRTHNANLAFPWLRAAQF